MGQQIGWLAVVVGILVSAVGAAETRPAQESDHIVVDDVKISYGATIKVEGRAFDVRDYRFDFVPAGVSALRINGKATQCQLHVQLVASAEGNRPKLADLERFKTGSCYEIQGQLLNARFSGTRNVCVVEVEAFRAVPDVTLKCQDFVDRGGKTKVSGTVFAMFDTKIPDSESSGMGENKGVRNRFRLIEGNGR
jgi:hypothetical protein